MLYFEHVSKRFGERRVLNDLTYAFPARGIVAVCGPSGCGKTTLLRLAAGLETPDEGTVRYEGHGLSMVFQEPRLFPTCTVRENLTLLQPRQSRRQAHAAADEWLCRVGLADAGDLYPDQLSGGMKQRVALARALLQPADLLLLDEPFSNLDATRKQQLYPLLHEQAQRRLLLLVSHASEDVQALADTVLDWNSFSPTP
jgi:ABC-type nitrate/sulfonate/bicarbonate transport system ATPase subunit